MPGVSGVLVVTNARVYYHYTRGYGCQGTRRSPRPLKGERFFNASGASRRGRFSHVWEKSRDDRVRSYPALQGRVKESASAV